MTFIISILFRVVGYGLILASLWYTPLRLARLWGLRRVWPICIAVAVGVILAVAGMVSLSASANPIVGLISNAAGLFFGLFVYSTLLMLCLDLGKPWLPFSDRMKA
jgi:hypothetical protein